MTDPAVRILGIDPGSQKTGWGIVEFGGRDKAVRHVDNGVFMLSKGVDLSERLRELSVGLSEIVERYRPHQAAVEDVFVNKGARSALVLGQARGAALATLGLCRVPVSTFASTQVKSRVTGRGRASKLQVANMVCVLLGLAEHPFEDAADALAIALCQAMALRCPVPDVPRALKKKARGGIRGGFAELARAQGKIS